MSSGTLGRLSPVHAMSEPSLNPPVSPEPRTAPAPTIAEPSEPSSAPAVVLNSINTCPITAFLLTCNSNAHEQQIYDTFEGELVKFLQKASSAYPATITLFGSRASGLCFLTSDFDISVSSGLTTTKAQHTEHVRKLANKFRKVADKGSVCPIYGATVPIVKAAVLDVAIDVSTSGDGTVETTRFVKEKKEQHPLLEPIHLFAKGVLGGNGHMQSTQQGLSSFMLFSLVLFWIESTGETGNDRHLLDAGVRFVVWLASYNFAGSIILIDGTTRPRQPSLVAIGMPVYIGSSAGTGNVFRSLSQQKLEKTRRFLQHHIPALQSPQNVVPTIEKLLTPQTDLVIAKRKALAQLSVAQVTGAFLGQPRDYKRRAKDQGSHQGSQPPTKRRRIEPAREQPHNIATIVSPGVASGSSTSTAVQPKKKKRGNRRARTRARLERESANAGPSASSLASPSLRYSLLLSPLLPSLCLLLLPLLMMGTGGSTSASANADVSTVMTVNGVGFDYGRFAADVGVQAVAQADIPQAIAIAIALLAACIDAPAGP